jgi:hypothetical protein
MARRRRAINTPNIGPRRDREHAERHLGVPSASLIRDVDARSVMAQPATAAAGWRSGSFR